MVPPLRAISRVTNVKKNKVGHLLDILCANRLNYFSISLQFKFFEDSQKHRRKIRYFKWWRKEGIPARGSTLYILNHGPNAYRT